MFPHCACYFQVHKKLGNTHLALMNFSWAMDLDPKGINNQIKEAIDKRYVTEEDDPLVYLNETGKVFGFISQGRDREGEGGVGGGERYTEGGREVKVIDKRYVTEEDHPLVYLNETGNVFGFISQGRDREGEGEKGGSEGEERYRGRESGKDYRQILDDQDLYMKLVTNMCLYFC